MSGGCILEKSRFVLHCGSSALSHIIHMGLCQTGKIQSSAEKVSSCTMSCNIPSLQMVKRHLKISFLRQFLFPVPKYSLKKSWKKCFQAECSMVHWKRKDVRRKISVRSLLCCFLNSSSLWFGVPGGVLHGSAKRTSRLHDFQHS